ncbi:MAG: Coenzyme F420:L-glutamate ligase [Candidatus Thorarchaeota archaeon]|nr:MAG: Coenzyme F420:L-glutamate ligase [Candidatus Thorarchaeota archaeon]
MEEKRATKSSIAIFPLYNYPLFTEKNCIENNIILALEKSKIAIKDRDIFVIAQKIVSKSEGRIVDGKSVDVSSVALEIAIRNGFDPIQVQLAIRESTKILRTDRVLITVTKNGMVCNFSGVDKSNILEGYYVLLPENPDYSAQRIREFLEKETGKKIAVIISDTQGRPWRRGGMNIAIGSSGVDAFRYNKGRQDLYGRELKRSTICQIDEIAAAAEHMMGQGSEGYPVIIVRGVQYDSEHCESASDVPRDEKEDLFR